jgi:hypothetical protein
VVLVLVAMALALVIYFWVSFSVVFKDWNSGSLARSAGCTEGAGKTESAWSSDDGVIVAEHSLAGLCQLPATGAL